jgi:hypothetical protein
MTTCETCGQEVDETVEAFGATWCLECFDAEYRHCEKCGNPYEHAEIWDVAYSDSRPDEFLCKDCVPTEAIYCDCCDMYSVISGNEIKKCLWCHEPFDEVT